MTPPQLFLDNRVTLYGGDCLDVLDGLPENSVDAIVTDPPYHLTSIVKRFGGANAAAVIVNPDNANATGAFARGARGFMGKSWDGGDIAFSPVVWAKALRVLKPGGHLVAFGGTRGAHRMACAIEDAGFEVRDSILNLSSLTDLEARFVASLTPDQSEALAQLIEGGGALGGLAWTYANGFPKSQAVSKFIDRALGAEGRFGDYKSAQRESDGKRGHINHDNSVSMKNDPWMDDPAAVDRHCRVYEPASPQAKAFAGFGTALKPAHEPICLARKPLSESTIAANILRWGTGSLNIDGCRIDAPEGVVRDINYEQAGRRGYGGGFNRVSEQGLVKTRWPANIVHDSSDEVLAGFPVTGPSSGAVRNSNAKPAGVAKGAEKARSGLGHADNGGSAARFFHSAKADGNSRLGSQHPTVKPVALMQWLVRLVTPPGGTILDMFAGTGTTGEAAYHEGFSAILIEREAEYRLDIARRLTLCRAGTTERRVAKVKASGRSAHAGPLFGDDDNKYAGGGRIVYDAFRRDASGQSE